MVGLVWRGYVWRMFLYDDDDVDDLADYGYYLAVLMLKDLLPNPSMSWLKNLTQEPLAKDMLRAFQLRTLTG